MAWLKGVPAAVVATRVRAFLLGVLTLPLGLEAAHWLLGAEVLRRLCAL